MARTRGRAARAWIARDRRGRHVGFAICIAVAITHPDAEARDCAPPTPACHLDNGRQLLVSDPKRAADELLASYQLDERTDTLALYATALERDQRYAHALETWQRVIVFREAELDAAKETARTATGRKRTAARAAVTRLGKQSEQAAAAIIKLWSNVGKVRIRIPASQQVVVSRGGVEVDATRDVLVNAVRDELVFTRRDGGSERVVVEVAAGGLAKIDAPAPGTRPEPPKIEPAKPPVEQPAPEEPAPEEPAPAAEEPAAEPAAEEPALSTTMFVDQPRSPTMARVGIGLAAGGLIAGGVAGALGYLASRDYDRAQELGCNADDQCPFGAAADLAQRSNDRARLAQISAIGGGALLAGGVVLWIVGRSKTRRAAPDVTLQVSPSSAAIGWRF